MAKPATNRFERRADLYNQTAENLAQRLADGADEKPALSADPSREELRALWHFSPVGDSEAASLHFWQTHAQFFAAAMQQALQGGAQLPAAQQLAHHLAEQGALEQTYPYRAKLIGVGTTDLPAMIKKAERLKKIAESEPAPGRR